MLKKPVEKFAIFIFVYIFVRSIRHNNKTNAMKTITYLSPISKLNKVTKTYEQVSITLYNVKLTENFGVQCYEGTTTKNGKILGWCCPSKVIELKTI